jgi:hypothetical protein
MRAGDAESNPWGVRLWTMFHMTKDAPLFQREESLRAQGWTLESNCFRRGEERFLPLYEAKLVQPYNHQAATFAGVPESVRFRTHARTRSASQEVALPRYWVPEECVRIRAGQASWFLGFRNAISPIADARSLVAAVIPRAGIGNSLPLISGPDARRTCLLLALLNSFILDYVLRQKASGSNLNFHVLRQLPVPRPDQIPGSLTDLLIRGALELTYTASALTALARECQYSGSPFPHEEERRWRLRCEMDAACLHLYGLTRNEAEHVLGSFPVLERRERARHGCFRSRDAILDGLTTCAASRATSRMTWQVLPTRSASEAKRGLPSLPRLCAFCGGSAQGRPVGIEDNPGGPFQSQPRTFQVRVRAPGKKSGARTFSSQAAILLELVD